MLRDPGDSEPWGLLWPTPADDPWPEEAVTKGGLGYLWETGIGEPHREHRPADTTEGFEDSPLGVTPASDPAPVPDASEVEMLEDGLDAGIPDLQRSKQIVFYPEVTGDAKSGFLLAHGRGSGVEDTLAYVQGRVPEVAEAGGVEVDAATHTASVSLIPDDGDPDEYRFTRFKPTTRRMP